MEIVIAIFSILAFVFIIGLCVYLVNKDTTSKHGNVTRSSYDESNAKLYGDIGEKIVGQRLEAVVNTYGGYLYNDFCFERSGFLYEIKTIFRCACFNFICGKFNFRESKKWLSKLDYARQIFVPAI